MNERIHEIALKTGITFVSGLHPSMVEKFAELIIQECANIAYAGVNPDKLDDYDRGWQKGRNLASELIKEHFRTLSTKELLTQAIEVAVKENTRLLAGNGEYSGKLAVPVEQLRHILKQFEAEE